MDSAPSFPLSTPLDSVIVPTADTVRYGYHMDSAIAMRRHLLMVGRTGTGKSAYIRGRLTALSSGMAPVFAPSPRLGV
jgi:dynein heavy chain